MIKRIVRSFYFVLFAAWIIGLSSCNNNAKENVSVRTGNVVLEDTNYFDSLVCSNK